MSEGELERFLRPALDAAFDCARQVAAADGEAAVPARVRPFLRFAPKKLPPKALTEIRLAVEEDAAFRQRVAAQVEESALGRAPWLWLARPDGWRPALDAEWDRSQAMLATERAAAQARAAEKTLAKANETIDRLRSERDQMAEELAGLRTELDATREERDLAARQRDDAQVAAAEATADRADAVAKLKDTEARLAARTQELRDLAAAEEDPTPVEAGPDLEELRAAVRALRAQVDTLTRTLGALADAVGLEDRPAAPAGGGAGGTAGAAAGRPARRRPHRLGRGLRDDSPAAAEALLCLPECVALVDGYNLTMTAWPGLSAAEQREALVRAARNLAARTGAEVHLVFDGAELAASQPPRSADDSVRVRFTAAGVEADDEILDLIASVPLERPVVVVSDDRRVRAGAAQRGANVVGSRQLQPLLLR